MNKQAYLKMMGISQEGLTKQAGVWGNIGRYTGKYVLPTAVITPITGGWMANKMSASAAPTAPAKQQQPGFWETLGRFLKDLFWGNKYDNPVPNQQGTKPVQQQNTNTQTTK